MAQVLCPVVVGRAQELTVLEVALDQAMAGHGGCVAITGEAGIGKSRLVRELVRMAADRHTAVVGGRAVPTSTATAYRPLSEALMQLLRGAPVPDDPSLRPWLGHLAAFVPEIVEPARQAPPSDGNAGACVARGEAVLRLVRHLRPEGLVVVLEDLHWADPDTVGVLEYLADNATASPLLFAVSLRSEPASPASDLVRRQRGRAGVRHLALGRLSEQEVSDMIAACRPVPDDERRRRVMQASEGVPFVVEELLASPGVPQSVTETVRARLGELAAPERRVLEVAAVMGRHFDWELLPAATSEDAQIVSSALAHAVDLTLIGTDSAASTDNPGFRFRHALTRDAVLADMLPPRVREAARSALAAIDEAHPRLEGHWRDIAADLAARSGDQFRAGTLLAGAGRRSLEVGALATAVQALCRAVGFLRGRPELVDAELALLQALALAGRVDEAADVALRVIARSGDVPETSEARMEAHLRLGQAAVAASRWPLARRHIEAALALSGRTAAPNLVSRAEALSADLALAEGDMARARRAAEAVIATDGASPDAVCHAYEIVGRTLRLHDLAEASAAFEAALSTAERHALPVWRMRALHELGTVEAFQRADVQRLYEARRAAEEMGALSTLAVLDLQLSAIFTARWDLAACDAHARGALELGRQLGLVPVVAKALALMAGSASMRADVEATESRGAQAMAADPSDPMLSGFCRASVGMALFMAGETEAAVRPFAEGATALSRLPNAEPISIRALWPLVQAARGDRRAAANIEELRRSGVGVFAVNRGMISFAQAVLEGRAGRPDRADAIVSAVSSSFAGCRTWEDLSRFVAAPSAVADRWGDPLRWLTGARERFAQLGLHRLADRCSVMLGDASSNPWATDGVTDREADVLRLVMDGLTNKQIAIALGLSSRTVEKHVESLLRKAGARSRTELAVTARRAAT